MDEFDEGGRNDALITSIINYALGLHIQGKRTSLRDILNLVDVGSIDQLYKKDREELNQIFQKLFRLRNLN